MIHYSAPWGLKLKLITGGVGALLLAIPLLNWNALAQWPGEPGMIIPFFLPITILVITALFTIRGYSVSPTEIVVERPIGTRRFSLATLQSVQFDPSATRGSIRLFANGGLFSFSGIFRNANLGTYRAYLTDTNRAVILFFHQFTLVLSPDDPVGFVETVNSLIHS